MALVSVVLPVRNGVAFLDAALGSLRAQSFADLEIIAIDDGSTDGTAAILRRHAAEDKRILAYTTPQAGVIAALTRGLALARGEFVARMDADDVALPERIALEVAFLKAEPRVGAVGSAMEVIDREGRVLRVVRPPTEPQAIRAALERGNCIAHPTVLMRKRAALEAGGYRPAFAGCEDYDLWLRMAERHDLANLDLVLLRYREHAGQATWQGLEQRLVSELGARVSAQARRAGKPDPAPKAGPVSRGWLERQGMTARALDRALFRRALDAAAEAARAGHRAALAEALALAAGQPRGALTERLRLLWLRLYWRRLLRPCPKQQ